MLEEFVNQEDKKMLEIIEAKLKEVSKQIEQVLANHNFLMGAKASLEQIYKDLQAAAPVAEAIVGAVDPAAAPAIDAAINTTESVINAVEQSSS
jgi:hypothetical protein